VVATLISSKHVAPKDAQDGHRYSLTATKVYRGDIPSTFSIWEENSSGRATFPWRIGTSYLLFLSYSKDDRAWTLDGCGNSGPIRHRSAALNKIEEIQQTKDGGKILGTLLFSKGTPEPVTVIARSSKSHRDYRAISNRQGTFRIDVLSGRYNLHMRPEGWTFQAYDLTYEDPKDLTIEDGGCAQVELQASKTK